MHPRTMQSAMTADPSSTLPRLPAVHHTYKDYASAGKRGGGIGNDNSGGSSSGGLCSGGSSDEKEKMSEEEIVGWYHAHVASETAGMAQGGIRGLNSFPGRLFRMLASHRHPELRDVIRWMDHGRAWKVLRPKVFAERVLPRFSGITKYSNFVRQVNAWGFRRVTSGRDEGCYYHEMFLRGRPQLVVRMRKPKGPKSRSRLGEQSPPDFYKMEWLPSEEECAAREGALQQSLPSPVQSSSGGVSTSANRHHSSGGQNQATKQQKQHAFPAQITSTIELPSVAASAQSQQPGAQLHADLRSTLAASLLERHMMQQQAQLSQQLQQLGRQAAAGITSHHQDPSPPLSLSINATINTTISFNYGKNNSLLPAPLSSPGGAWKGKKEEPSPSRSHGTSRAVAAPSSAAATEAFEDVNENYSFVDPFDDHDDENDNRCGSQDGKKMTPAEWRAAEIPTPRPSALSFLLPSVPSSATVPAIGAAPAVMTAGRRDPRLSAAIAAIAAAAAPASAAASPVIMSSGAALTAVPCTVVSAGGVSPAAVAVAAAPAPTASFSSLPPMLNMTPFRRHQGDVSGASGAAAERPC